MGVGTVEIGGNVLVGPVTVDDVVGRWVVVVGRVVAELDMVVALVVGVVLPVVDGTTVVGTVAASEGGVTAGGWTGLVLPTSNHQAKPATARIAASKARIGPTTPRRRRLCWGRASIRRFLIAEAAGVTGTARPEYGTSGTGSVRSAGAGCSM